MMRGIYVFMPFTRYSSLDVCYRWHVGYYSRHRAHILFTSTAWNERANKIRSRIDISGNEYHANGPLIIRGRVSVISNATRADGISVLVLFSLIRTTTFPLNQRLKFNYRGCDPRESIKRPATSRRCILRRRERSETWKNLMDDVRIYGGFRETPRAWVFVIRLNDKMSVKSVAHECEKKSWPQWFCQKIHPL